MTRHKKRPAPPPPPPTQQSPPTPPTVQPNPVVAQLSASDDVFTSDSEARPGSPKSPAIQHSYRRPVKRSGSSSIVKPSVPPPAPPGKVNSVIHITSDHHVHTEAKQVPRCNNSTVVSEQGKNSPSKATMQKIKNVKVREKKMSLFSLCCGLRAHRVDSPEEDVELPLRTEGTLRKNNDETENVFSSSNDLVVLPGGEISCQSSLHNMNADSKKDLVASPTIITEKPVIQNVKICYSQSVKQSQDTKDNCKNNLYNKRKRNMTLDPKTFSNEEDVNFRTNKPSNRNSLHVRSQSVEDLTFCMFDLDLDLATHFERNKTFRSSFFAEENKVKPPVLNEPGEFQTILRHTKGEKIYALPQPQCYGESTLKAVKRITEKYDTLQRWKIRAMSFRDETLKNSDKLRTQKSIEEADDTTDSYIVNPSDNTEPSKRTENQSKDSVKKNVPFSRQISKSVMLSDGALQQIGLFYKGYETEVYVCHCTADLYIGEIKEKPADWKYTSTGVPVLLLNTGHAKRLRQLSFIVADRHSSFPLWQDKINHLSKFQEIEDGFFSMHCSETHKKMAGIKFHCVESAKSFQETFSKITKDPYDDLWNISSVKNKRKNNKKKKFIPGKGDISNPLNFTHMTCLTSTDPTLLENLSDFIPKTEIKNDILDPEFRTRAYSG